LLKSLSKLTIYSILDK